MVVAFVACFFFCIIYYFTPDHDENEPPSIPTNMPLVGHIFGMLRYGSRYYDKIATKYPELPIYRLDVPGRKVYVVTDPDLIQAVDRRPKEFSFGPIVLQFATRFLIASQETVQKLAAHGPSENGTGQTGLTPETLKIQHESLAPGKDLEAITQTMLSGILRFLNPSKAVMSREVGLCEFFKQFVTVVSTESIYGHQNNPYQDQRVIDALWQIYRDFGLLGLNISPGLLAPKGNAARQVVFSAMNKYYANDGQKTASRLIQDRLAVNRKYDVPQNDIDHFDLAIGFGLLANAPAAMFWIIFCLYSNAYLLNEIRQTIESLPSIQQGLRNAKPTDKASVSVDIAEVVDCCPILGSFINEVLRVQSTSASARIVTRDTWLNGKYLLKKNNFILVPSLVVHRNEHAWGQTAASFDASRFLSGEHKSSRLRKQKVPMSANRIWGGGSNMCPGRYFAMRELLAILIITVLRYDITPAAGKWEMPETRGHMSASVMEPVKDPRVRIEERKVMQGLTWVFTWGATNQEPI